MKIKNLNKKIFIILGIFVVQGYFLHLFYINEQFFYNLKISTITKVYLPSFAYSFRSENTQDTRLLANALGALQSDNTKTSALNNEEFAKSVPVLVYHGVIDNPDEFSILQEDFRKQLFALKDAGYSTVKLSDFYSFIKGEKQLPAKSFVLTFDDGRKDSYYPVDPILSALNYTAVMFVATKDSFGTESKNSTYYLNENELETMVDSQRWELGSHAIQEQGGFIPINIDKKPGHFLTNYMWLEEFGRLESEIEYSERIRHELVDSKNIIEKETKSKITSASFPFGDYGQETLNNEKAEEVISEYINTNYIMSFRQARFDTVFIQNYPYDDPYRLKRIEVGWNWTPENLLSVLNTSEGKSLPYFDNFENQNGWVMNWGEMTLTKQGMHTGSNYSTQGSSILLDGSYFWKNYLYSIKTDWLKGETVSLLGRYKNIDNYVACTFSDQTVRIETVRDDIRNTVSTKSYGITESQRKNLNLSIAVVDNDVTCLVDGNAVVTSKNTKNILSRGGIGLGSWSLEKNNSALLLKEISVDEINELNSINKNLQGRGITPPETIKTPISEQPPKPTTTPATPIALPYSVTDFTGSTLWKNQWGNVLINYEALLVGAVANTSGGFATLNGSNGWGNYSVTVKPKSMIGTTFSIVARYTDPQNYVTCTYENTGSRGYARIDKTVAGIKTQVGTSQPFQRYFPYKWDGIPFTMSVVGDRVSCLANGSEVIGATATGIAPAGGIGIKTWDSILGRSVIQIKELYVEALN